MNKTINVDLPDYINVRENDNIVKQAVANILNAQLTNLKINGWHIDEFETIEDSL